MAKELNFDTWEKDVMQSQKPVVVDFWHEQCIWCQRLNPIYEELSKEYKGAVLAKLNIRANEENLQLAIKYGVTGTPTMKIFCNGRVTGEIIGFMDKAKLKEELDRAVSKSKECLDSSTELKK